MSRSNKRESYNDGCCRDEKKMVLCAVTALEKMRDMFHVKHNSSKRQCGGGPRNVKCAMGESCKIKGCLFHGETLQFAPNTLRKLCGKDTEMAYKPKTDKNAMKLQPGEVGLQGDRATFHLGATTAAATTASSDETKKSRVGRPTGAMYYQMQPGANANHVNDLQTPNRMNVMQVLPSLPATKTAVVGPVTGFPIDGTEHVFVLRLGKRFNESEDIARLQIEVRLPKVKEDVPVNVSTQYREEDYSPPAPEPVMKLPKKKGKKGAKGKKGKK